MSRAVDPAEPTQPLTLVVFHILLALADGARHGYAIAQEVETLTEGQVRMGAGTLYGSLQRMVSDGLIEPVARQGADAERRRYYKSTPRGRKLLQLELARLGRIMTLARRKQLLRATGSA